MGKNFDYVIFDLDGTLLDTRKGVISAAVRAIKEYNYQVPEQPVLESFIGPPMQVSFKKLFDLTEPKAMEMANKFRDFYKTDEFLFQAEPYQGIYDLFLELISEGAQIGIATYKREDYAKRLLCEKGFDRYTDFMFGSDFEGKLKKHDIIRLCLEKMGCKDFSQAVYIGDGESDGKGANAVGMNFLAVTYGFGFKSPEDAKGYNPVGIAANCKQIEEIILDGVYTRSSQDSEPNCSATDLNSSQERSRVLGITGRNSPPSF